MRQVAWIAVDWGTSHLRAWLMDARDVVIEKRVSDAGMAHLPRDGFAGALADLVGGFSGPVVACGMVGSRQGWVEAPYASAPCKPPSVAQATAVGPVRILPGVKQQRPADVMRGEETQIAGFMAEHPDFDGVICLPGTHTKWVHVSAGEIVSFRTAMTGELYALLSDQSVLRHSLGDGWDAQAFAYAVNEALSKPEALAANLFNIRAAGLLNELEPQAARARLSGLLIGAELASMRAYWLGQAVAIVGEQGLAATYAAAMNVQGVTCQVADADAMTLRGLCAAKSALVTT